MAVKRQRAKRGAAAPARARKGAAAPAVAKKRYVTKKAEQDMEVMKVMAEVVDVKTPKDWPADTFPNVRAFAPLPEGWHHAKRLTNKSGRGSGGIMRHCYVGPEGKTFWHKKDLEKHLGFKIESPDDVQRPRMACPLIFTEYPKDAVLTRTEKQAKTEYINKRCNLVNGLTVHKALQEFEYDYEGQTFPYNLSDLRYDVQGGRLTVDTPGGGTVKPKKVPAASRKKAAVDGREARAGRVALGAASKAAAGSKSAASKAPVVDAAPLKRPAAALLALPAPAAKRTAALLALPAPAAKGTAPAAASSSSGSASSSAGPQITENLMYLMKKVYAPLKRKAASGAKDEASIFSLMGVGHKLGMDPLMLGVLESVLKKNPAERGEFGEGVIRQFEAALKKHM